MRSLRLLPFSALALVVACSDDPTDPATSSDGGAPNDDGGVSNGEGGAAGDGAAGDAGGGCRGIGCVDQGKSIHKAIAYDATKHPIVAYAASDGIRVRRWNDTAWEALGAPIAGRETLAAGFQLHVVAGKPTLVSGDPSTAGGLTHVQTFDGASWSDVAGSPVALPSLGAADSYAFDSVARGDAMHVVMASTSGLETFHVRKWDGATLTNETEATGAAGSKGVAPKIGVRPDGAIATAYGRGPSFITTNVAGTTTWTLGTAAADGYASSDVSFSFVWTATGGIMTRFDDSVAGTGRVFAVKGDGQAAFAPAGGSDGLVESSQPSIGAPVLITDATDRVLAVVPFFESSTDVATHVRVFDGSAWSTPIEGTAGLAGSVAPSTLAAASHDKVVGVVTESRLDFATPYIRYEELTLP